MPSEVAAAVAAGVSPSKPLKLKRPPEVTVSKSMPAEAAKQNVKAKLAEMAKAGVFAKAAEAITASVSRYCVLSFWVVCGVY